MVRKVCQQMYMVQCQLYVLELKGNCINTFSDNDDPELDCNNLVFTTDEGVSTASNYTIQPNVQDNVDPSPVLVCSHSSFDTFELGDTTVTCNATDLSGNVATCSFFVRVVGKYLPCLRCEKKHNECARYFVGQVRK